MVPKRPSKVQEPVKPLFLVVPPQKQNLAYSIQQFQQAAPVVVAPAEPKAAVLYTVQQSSAPLVVAAQGELAQPARLQVVPVSAATTSVFTPFSSSVVQVYQ